MNIRLNGSKSFSGQFDEDNEARLIYFKSLQQIKGLQ